MHVPVTGPDRNRPRARGDIAVTGASPSKSPVPLRIARRLRACTPSKSDRSGTPRAAMGRGQVYRCEGRRSGPIAAEKETFHFAPQLRHGSIERLRPRIDDNGPLRIQPIETDADRFPQPPFDAIARHGLAEPTRNREPDPGTVRRRLANTKSREARARKPAALVVNPSEISRTQQANTFRKTSDGLVPFGADRELLAPTRPAPRQDRPAILSLHAGAETMRFRAPAIIRLIRTLRHSRSIT